MEQCSYVTAIMAAEQFDLAAFEQHTKTCSQCQRIMAVLVPALRQDIEEALTTTLPRFTCQHCGHTWVPRQEGRPLRCGKCKSPYWNRPCKTPRE